MAVCPVCLTPLTPTGVREVEGRLDELADSCRKAFAEQLAIAEPLPWAQLQASEQERWREFAKAVLT